MIDVEQSEFRHVIMEELKQRMHRAQVKYGFRQALLQELRDIFYDVRVRARNRNIDFPQMVAVVVPSINLVACLRADLSNHAIQISALNIVTQYPMVDMVELAQAFGRAFPHYTPST